MTRYFVRLSYNGTNYHGWQYQPNAITVQETLNKAFSIILREEINLTGAGRTDTGVHARNFYAHFDSNSENIEQSKLSYKLNGYLPKDILIQDIFKMPANAHARFDAVKRTYKYYIANQKEIFLDNYCWQLYAPLNISLMNKAASLLLNFKDFTSFSKLHTDVKTNNCKIIEAFWTQMQDQLVFTISADRFLRNMVRSIVGTLIDIGLEKLPLNQLEAIILKRDRNEAGASVPAKGLFLENIEYPYKIGDIC